MADCVQMAIDQARQMYEAHVDEAVACLLGEFKTARFQYQRYYLPVPEDVSSSDEEELHALIRPAASPAEGSPHFNFRWNYMAVVAGLIRDIRNAIESDGILSDARDLKGDPAGVAVIRQIVLDVIRTTPLAVDQHTVENL